MRKVLVGLGASLLGLAGCFPATYTKLPALEGRVVNMAGDPVTDVTIAALWVAHDPERPGVVISQKVIWQDMSVGPDGRFKSEEKAMWGIYIMPMDIFERTMQVQARRNGFILATQDLKFLPYVRPFGLGKAQQVEVGELVVP